jgi:hypothetical protein
MDASACEKVEAVREKMAATALDDGATRSEQIAAAAALANLTDAQTRRMDVSARLAPPAAPILTPAGAETAAQPAAPAEPEKKTWLEKIEDKLTPAAAPAIAA